MKVKYTPGMLLNKRRFGKYEEGFIQQLCTGAGAEIEQVVAFVVWGLGSSIAVW